MKRKANPFHSIWNYYNSAIQLPTVFAAYIFQVDLLQINNCVKYQNFTFLIFCTVDSCHMTRSHGKLHVQLQSLTDLPNFNNIMSLYARNKSLQWGYILRDVSPIFRKIGKASFQNLASLNAFLNDINSLYYYPNRICLLT